MLDTALSDLHTKRCQLELDVYEREIDEQLEGPYIRIARRGRLRALDACVILEDVKLSLHAARVRRKRPNARLIDVADVDLREVLCSGGICVVIRHAGRVAQGIGPRLRGRGALVEGVAGLVVEDALRAITVEDDEVAARSGAARVSSHSECAADIRAYTGRDLRETRRHGVDAVYY